MKRCLVLLAITGALLLTLSQFRPDAPSPIKVTAVAAKAGSSVVSVSASGLIEPYRTRTLGLAGYGTVDRVYLNVGSPVLEGQVIMTFSADSSPSADLSAEKLLETADVSSLLDGDLASAVDGSIADLFTLSQLVSPFDGVITAIWAAQGEQASPLSPLAEVSDFSRIRARVRISEADFPSVTVGMPAEITSGGASYDGVVIEVSPMVRSTATLTGGTERYGEALIELYHPEGVTVGCSADGEIFTSRRTGVMTLPFTAVDQDEQNREYVYVAEDGFARRRLVTTGCELGSSVEITSGIQPGDLVITGHSGDLTDGCPVEVE